MANDEIIEAIRARVSEGRATDHDDATALPAPASEEAIAEAERVIGYPLLRIYREIANGGIGPFLGIEGLRGGYAGDGPSLVDAYLMWQEADPDPSYPPPLPRWESGNRDKLILTLSEWFEAWLAGDIEKAREDPRLMLADEAWHHPDDD